MTDDVRGEFEEWYEKKFPAIYFLAKIKDDQALDHYSDHKSLFNEAYAKGRQSVLDKIPNEQLVDTEILKILKLDFTHTYSLKVFYKWLISKLSDDKGG